MHEAKLELFKRKDLRRVSHPSFACKYHESICLITVSSLKIDIAVLLGVHFQIRQKISDVDGEC